MAEIQRVRADGFDLIDSVADNDELIIWDASEEKVLNATIDQLKSYILGSIQYGAEVSVGMTGSGATYECDGSNDDIQIQAAYDYLNGTGGGKIKALRGTYDIVNQITVYPTVLLEGEGAATLFDGSSMDVAPTENLYMFQSTSAADKSDFAFRDFAIKGFFTDGTGSTYAVVPAVSGILVSNARRVLVQNVYFQDVWNATTIGRNPDTGDDSLGAGNIKQVIFDGNQCNNVLGGLQGYSQDRVIWVNNHFENVGDDAIAFLSANNDDPGSFKAVISNNTFVEGRPQNSNGVYGVGVFLKLDGGGFGPENLVDITVTGNIIDKAYIGLWYANASNIVTNGNIIRDSYLSGIYESGGVAYSNTYGNRIINSNTANNANHAGILHVSSTDSMVEHNQIEGTASGFKQGIISQGSPVNVTYSYNQIKDATGFAAIYCETFDGLRADGNQITNGARGILYGGDNGSICHNDLYGTFSLSEIADTGSSTNIRENNNSTGGNLVTENTITATATASFFDITPGSNSYVRVRNGDGNLQAHFKSGAGSSLELLNPAGTTYLHTGYQGSTTSTDVAYRFRTDGSLYSAGGNAFAINEYNTNVTLTSADWTAIFDCSAASRTCLLPAANTCKGRVHNVKKKSASNTLTIDPNSTDTIEDVATFNMTADGDSVTIQSDGVSNWVII